MIDTDRNSKLTTIYFKKTTQVLNRSKHTIIRMNGINNCKNKKIEIIQENLNITIIFYDIYHSFYTIQLKK